MSSASALRARLDVDLPYLGRRTIDLHNPSAGKSAHADTTQEADDKQTETQPEDGVKEEAETDMEAEAAAALSSFAQEAVISPAKQESGEGLKTHKATTTVMKTDAEMTSQQDGGTATSTRNDQTTQQQQHRQSTSSSAQEQGTTNSKEEDTEEEDDDDEEEESDIYSVIREECDKFGLKTEEKEEVEKVLTDRINQYLQWLRQHQSTRLGKEAGIAMIIPEKQKQDQCNHDARFARLQQEAINRLRGQFEQQKADKRYKQIIKLFYGQDSLKKPPVPMLLSQPEKMDPSQWTLAYGLNGKSLYFDADVSRIPGLPPQHLELETLTDTQLQKLALEEGYTLKEALSMSENELKNAVAEYSRSAEARSDMLTQEHLYPRKSAKQNVNHSRKTARSKTPPSFKEFNDTISKKRRTESRETNAHSSVKSFKDTAKLHRDDGNINFCTFCGGVGQLICCDLCPRAFHEECLGIKIHQIQTNQWFCLVCKHGVAYNRQVVNVEERFKIVPGGEMRTLGGANPLNMLPRPVCYGAGSLSGELYVQSIMAGSAHKPEVVGEVDGESGFRTCSDLGQWRGDNHGDDEESRDVALIRYVNTLPRLPDIDRQPYWQLAKTPLSSCHSLKNHTSFMDGNIKGCLDILHDLQLHEFASPFLMPIVPEKLGIPDYFNVIKLPMDLASVEARMRKGHYHDDESFATLLQQVPVEPVPSAEGVQPNLRDGETSPKGVVGFITDIRRIWWNCKRYNSKNTVIWRMADTLQRESEVLFRRRLKLDDTSVDLQKKCWIAIDGDHNLDDHTPSVSAFEGKDDSADGNDGNAAVSEDGESSDNLGSSFSSSAESADENSHGQTNPPPPPPAP